MDDYGIGYGGIKDQDVILRDICEKSLKSKYPDAGKEYRDRLEWELHAIKNTKTAFLFIQTKAVMDQLALKSFEISSRGNVGGSLVAHLCGFSEVNPIQCHIVPYFFYGFHGEKEPDIDLNYRIGILEKIPETYKSTPEGRAITDIVPVTKIVEDGKELLVTGVDYYSLESPPIIIDVIGHRGLELLKRMYDLTGMDPTTISFEDPEVLEMFAVAEDGSLKCSGVVEFSTEFMKELLKQVRPKNFADLVKMSALSHGTQVWNDNAELLLRDKMISFDEVFACREDIFDVLVQYGIEEETAFQIAEEVRRGRIKTGRCEKWKEWQGLLREHGVPEWFFFTFKRITYMFPRAHTWPCVCMAWRMAWYKLHYPTIFEQVRQELYEHDLETQ